ncbi:ABC transporter transmembrane region [Musa troglodytarum]|uniref:ABC transporter transmembrane region n=1 Tax=Musa troglodytarum TaxID=320322 RepID=A0A9E7FZV8_9LILI|nr:ABC transporter transmembrane region [Musa troglodytarum]
MDIDKYDKVLEACSLKKDLEIMPNGDQTVIGERGINLSGGQKQRVQIARAIYHDADIYMFDDPFSAVDAHTGSHLFKVIRDGRIVQAGKYNEIINSGTEFMELVGSHMDALAAHNMKKHTSNTSSDTIQGGPSTSKSSVPVPQQPELKDTENGPLDEGRPRGQLVQEEERETGKVGFLIYWSSLIMLVPQQYYISTAREVSRLIGVCSAPVIQHFAESMSGSISVRSFGQEKEFVNTNYNLTNDISRLQFHNTGAMQWLCFRLDMLSTLTFAFSLIFLISMPEGVIDPGIAGLAVTYGLSLNMIQTWFIWNLCSLENEIISVERILQYTNIPSEPPLVIDESRPDHIWPSKGEIDLLNLQVRYGLNMPFILRGLTCTLPGGKKIGIVGRTGSGKSTLVQTIFRIIDPTVGHIFIDGIDISTIGLHDLRSRLSIIPQDPIMFEGTVRNNLDPLEEYTDEQIWEALDCCQLGEEIRNKELKLDSEVTENGENWSVGQRQLVCLGRVILRKSKILVLDEATASVDTTTDIIIQKTLRQQFSESTVIMIAHRITSVIDSDIVILLDNGMIVENDSPTKLLENKSSLFAKLVFEYTTRFYDASRQ